MKFRLLLVALVALLNGCADVEDIDESRPADTYRGPISGPMSGPLTPVSPNRPGALGIGDSGTDNSAPADEAGR